MLLFAIKIHFKLNHFVEVLCLNIVLLKICFDVVYKGYFDNNLKLGIAPNIFALCLLIKNKNYFLFSFVLKE